MADPHSIPEPLERLSDEELIVGFQNGNAAAFNVLVGRYKDQLTNYVFRFMGDWDECSDIVQDTFVRVFQNRNAYKPVARFSTWIYTIATNAAKSRTRKKNLIHFFSLNRQGEDNEGAYEVPDESARADIALESSMEDQRIQKALDSLGAKSRQVIILRDVQELSYEEIAGITGLSMGTVKSRINRARLKLQEMLRDE